ncbi:MAG: hypothetical protein IJV98_03555 [Clostridia bacterium]|nr:hypothetical protein [Clostridia bacterium]
MKRIFSIVLSAALMLGVSTLGACGKRNKPLRLGLGIHTSVTASDATEDKNGEGRASVTGAAVLVDAEGRIVRCFLDCAENPVAYTADGKAIASEDFATKYEMGDAYHMKTYGGAVKEWYAQADTFCSIVTGKTVSEVKALVASDGKGTQDVIKAGCTIAVSEFVMAIEKAVADAVISEATKNDTVRLTVSTAQTTSDATEDKDGNNQLEITLFAAALNAEKQITAATADCVQIGFTFDESGVSTLDTAKPIASKGEMGDAYGMKAYGGAVKEWYEQAEVFCDACVGKTAGALGALVTSEGYGTAELQAAGCTISVDGFVKAAEKLRAISN